jgi:hypothetical protein
MDEQTLDGIAVDVDDPDDDPWDVDETAGPFRDFVSSLPGLQHPAEQVRRVARNRRARRALFL